MAKVLNYESQIQQGEIVQSWHVSQSVDAFTGAEDYAISISGSVNLTSSLSIKPVNLLTTGQNYVLTYNNTTGQVFKALSSSIQASPTQTVYRTGSGTNIIPALFGSNKASSSGSVVAGGFSNTASFNAGGFGACTFIGAGFGNTSSVNNSFIGAGFKNSMDDSICNTAIVAGCFNAIGSGQANDSACNSLIGAGALNCIGPDKNGGDGQNSVIAGGCRNFINSYNSFIGAGVQNSASEHSCFSIIGAGQSNTISASMCSFIGSGHNNCILASLSGSFNKANAIVGGSTNKILRGECNIIGSGERNIIGFDVSNVLPGAKYTFIGAGILNSASRESKCSFIGGGCGNSSCGYLNFIGGGEKNCTSDHHTTVVGGGNNIVSGEYGFIGGGFANQTGLEDYLVIVGGSSNCITDNGCNSFIGGGCRNKICSTSGLPNYRSPFSSILGGCQNAIGNGAFNAHFSVIGGGQSNTSSACYSGIFSGLSNYICNGHYSTIVGGTLNTASSACSFIGGGKCNKVDTQSPSSVIGGGTNNIITSASHGAILSGINNEVKEMCGVIGGGHCNVIQISANNLGYNVIGGGQCNETACGGAAVLGGAQNDANGCLSFIGGGFRNKSDMCYGVIAGGCDNKLSTAKCRSSIVGGALNTISSSFSFIGGGYANTSSGGNYNVIVGGFDNVSFAACSFIGAGSGSFISGSNDHASFIGAGKGNKIQGHLNLGSSYSAIVAGDRNLITGATASLDGNNLIGAGQCNIIEQFAHNSFIGGGLSNKISSCYNAARDNSILGGRCNCIISSGSQFALNSIVGGSNNKMIQLGSSSPSSSNAQGNTITGGSSNCIITANGNVTTWKGYNTIVGGIFNRIIDSGSAQFNRNNIVGGGTGNFISGSTSSAVIGSHIGCVTNMQNSVILGGCSICLCSTTAKNSVVVAALCNKTIAANNSTLYTCNVCAYGNLDISGTANATVKSFVIPHPDPEKTATYELWHTSIESPTAGDTMYRFSVTTINNEAEIILPEYYRYLNKDSQLWVSADGHFGKAFGLVNISATKIKITSNEDGKYNIMLVGTRKDKDAVASWKGAERLKK